MPFKLKYAPHAGHFKEHAGKDILDQIKFAHEQGFRGWEDNTASRREPAEQEAIGKLMSELDMLMGVFVSFSVSDFKKPIFAGVDTAEGRKSLQEAMKPNLDVAKRLGAKWTTVVPGTFDHRKMPGQQLQNTVDCFKALAEVCEPEGLVMVIEPLNFRNHPDCYVSTIDQAYHICKAVDSPSVKILADLYHEQIQSGDIIRAMDEAWSEIPYLQVGDNPGRKEPYTGEINYNNVFKWLHEKGFEGIVGMEHGKSVNGKKGEQVLIDAYRKADTF